MMFLKIHKAYREIIALCDAELLGKRFEQDNFQLDVKESFYSGEKMSEKEIIPILQDYAKEDVTFNIVGKKSCQTALKAGIIMQQVIGKIDSIPFALVLV